MKNDVNSVREELRACFTVGAGSVGEDRFAILVNRLADVLTANDTAEVLTLFGHYYFLRSEYARAADCYLTAFDREGNGDAALGLAAIFDVTREDERVLEWVQAAMSNVPAPTDYFITSSIRAAEARALLPAFAAAEPPQPDWTAAKSRLLESVAGHREVLNEVCDALRPVFMLGRIRKRPRAVFVFTGPAGVGKKSSTAALAEAIWGERRIVFADALDLARLAMARPGEAGDDPPDLVTSMKRWGSLVLSIRGVEPGPEGAEVQKILARMIRRAILPTPWGAIDLRGTIMTFTHTAATPTDTPTFTLRNARRSERSIDWAATATDELSQAVDRVFTFVALDREDARQGVCGYWRRVVRPALAKRGYEAELTREAEELLLLLSWDGGLGPIVHIVEDKLLSLVSERDPGRYVFDVEGNRFVLKSSG